MMMAEVGGIVNVSGNKIAIPFAPPKPGNTPIITPNVTPTSISIKLKGDIATAGGKNPAALDEALNLARAALGRVSGS